MERPNLSCSCPYCGVGMRATAMECPSCRTEIRGPFRQSLFQMLSDEEQQFLEQYLLSDFNIKSMARQTGMGYAAIRSRLDRLISNYQRLSDVERARKAVLQRLADGGITAREAAEQIRGLGNGQ